ncbi:hypothetical protein LCGC14_1910180 [marine sediment metagenome]|uniref:Uncharacterized protein n=1 Tax=marine sediment metagenome TaxID=412755 RepID=A0A0F9FTV3_9ZZZZ
MPFECVRCGEYLDKDSGAPYQCPKCKAFDSFVRCKSRKIMNKENFDATTYYMLKDFMGKMFDVLEEKFEKYRDSWKTIPIGELRPKINEQIQIISDIISTDIDWDREQVKRKLLHIANYCFFLYSKLE